MNSCILNPNAYLYPFMPSSRHDSEREQQIALQEQLSHQQEVESEERLHNPPEHGEVIEDYFGFNEIFARVLSTADHELNASKRYLFWSALGAGAALGLTFIARVIFTDASEGVLPQILGNLLYPVGFLIIVLGRYQLFTENTLTPVVLVLTRLASVVSTLKLWVVVLVANFVGAVGVAALMHFTKVFTADQVQIAVSMAEHALDKSFFELFSRAVFAGWIVATMVWLVHAARDTISKIFFVYILMFFIGVAGFFHIITSSVEVFYLAMSSSSVDFLPLFPNFVWPVLLGNTVGGVTFVALLNYALFSEHEDSDLFLRYGERLSAKEWCLGSKAHQKNSK